MTKIWVCGPHLYSIDSNGKMRIAQPTIPRANENVLNGEETAKVVSGVCPRCCEKLEIRYL